MPYEDYLKDATDESRLAWTIGIGGWNGTSLCSPANLDGLMEKTSRKETLAR